MNPAGGGDSSRFMGFMILPGGRAVFRRKQGDVDDRQCDHRDPSQRITPSVLCRTGVGGAAAYEWLGAACSCGQNSSDV